MPKVIIIVLSYNSLEETTKPCLESIFAAQSDADFEVLVVDNASTDDTRDYLQQLQAQHANLKLILNRENKGFAGGNNAGIRAADADFYVLLNSDTRVTDHWLDKMLAFANEHPEVGLLGPVSNTGRQRANYCICRPEIRSPSFKPAAVMPPGRKKLVLHFFAGLFLRDDPQRGLPENRPVGRKLRLRLFRRRRFLPAGKVAGLQTRLPGKCFYLSSRQRFLSPLRSDDLFRKNRRYYREKKRLQVANLLPHRRVPGPARFHHFTRISCLSGSEQSRNGSPTV